MSDTTMVCKFKCDEVRLTKTGGEVTLSPVTGGSEDNDKFFRFTPYGKLHFGLISLESATMFIPGEEYYLTFSQA